MSLFGKREPDPGLIEGRDSDSLLNTIVEHVSEEGGVPPTDLTPLYDTIDPDALVAVIEGMKHGSIRFQYAGRVVTVHHDGAVDVGIPAESGSTAAGRATDD